MRPAGGLYDRIADPENIRLAYWKAAKGKQDRSDRIAFGQDLGANIRSLHRQLIDGTVKVGNYRFFTVNDPKRRKICAAAFSERVLHHAIMNVCEPVLDGGAIFDSYACRKGKGTHKAIQRVQRFAGKYPWFLKLDIHKYFDSIDHGITLNLLARRIKDRAVLKLFQSILGTFCTGPGRGLPIGNLISQHLANFYLGVFDHWIKEEYRANGYLRYMDDFIIFRRTKAELKKDLAEISRFLEQDLRLVLNPKMQLNRCRYGIPFLGLRVFPGRVRLSPASRKRFAVKLKQYEANWQRGDWSMKDLIRHIEPLVGFTRVADAAGFRRDVVGRYGVSF